MLSLATTQQVPVTYQEAGLMPRISAFAIDGVIVGAAYSLLLLLLIPTVGFNILESGLAARFTFWLLPMGGLILYHFLWEALRDGQSPGKRIIGLKVIRLDGKEIQMYDYLLRAILHLLETVLSFGSIALLLIGFTKRHQRLGDLVAHTVVVKIKGERSYSLKDIEELQALSTSEQPFQNLSQFSDQEMVIVKQLLERHQAHPNDVHQKLVRQVANGLAEKLKMEPPVKAAPFLKNILNAYVAQTR